MREVIRIPESIPVVEEVLPIEFTHMLDEYEGWIDSISNLSVFSIQKVVYLGKCSEDGDMFAVYTNLNEIVIYRGHLNSGKY